MAHRRRNFRSTSKKGATAFAPSASRDGRTLGWESLSGPAVPPVIQSTVFNVSSLLVGSVNTRFVTLVPQNLTRGTITLERIRGHLAFYWDQANDLAVDLDRWPIMVGIQLVPLRDGAIQNPSVLSMRNAGDLESNRILWRRTYMPDTGTTITSPGAIERTGCRYNNIEIDVKSRRRFDRATWALVMSMDIDVDSVALASLELRGLFRSSDGL